MRSQIQRLSRIGVYFVFALQLAACGQDNWVKEVEADLYADQGEVLGEIHIYMHTGGINLAAINLPIYAPNRNVEIGRMSLGPVVGTDYVNHVLSLLINFSELAQIPQGVEAKLPNGDALPLLVKEGSVLALPVGNSGSRVYVHMDSSVERVFVGVAVPLQGLGNPIGQQVSGFQPVPLSSTVRAWFGMFFGTTSLSNGFGVFVDAQSAFKNSPDGARQLKSLSQSSLGVMSVRTARSTQAPSFEVSAFDTGSRQKLDRHIWSLHSKKATLHVN